MLHASGDSAVKGKPATEAGWWQGKVAAGRGMRRGRYTGLVVKASSTKERGPVSRVGSVRD